MIKKKLSLLILVLFFSGFNVIQAQDWDYEKYPKLDINIVHLDAELRVLQTGEIQGDILYNIEFNVEVIDSLVLDASRMNVSSVYLNDQPVDFSIDLDELVIYLPENSNRTGIANLRIQYMAEPGFGVHQDEYGTIWTSMLPNSTRHWLPVIDNPRVAFTTELVFTHPSGYTVVANGRINDSEIVSVDEELTSYVSNNRIPASALSWAIGDFSQISSTANATQLREFLNNSEIEEFRNRMNSQIHLYATLNNIDGVELLESAVEAFLTVSEITGLDYPFEELNIVILDDHTWETKSYGAGTVFVYKNAGSLTNQIKMGILSQWVGVQIREPQWSDSDAVLFLQSVFADKFEDFELEKNYQKEPYHVFSQKELLRWLNFINERETRDFKIFVDQVYDDLFSGRDYILGWQDFASLIYEKTGQPYFDEFSPGEVHVLSNNETPIEYIAELDWNEEEGTMQIRFNAVDESINELVTVEVEEITFFDNREHELTFTGASDAVTLNVSSNIENIKLRVTDNDQVKLREEKPEMFWIFQLRNDEDISRRKDAAEALARFDENPDLQLALDDILRIETNPEVYAEILRSLSALTSGASGTDERFINMSSNQQPPEVQKAAVEALAHFNNNERVINRLQNVILQTDNREVRKAAIHSLARVTEAGRFNSIVNNVVTRESALYEIPLLLSLLAEKGEEESAVELSATFVTKEFPYEVRVAVLDMLIEYDQNPSNWMDRLLVLITDRDPRIRYKATEGLDRVGVSDRRQILNERLIEEYDERVRRALSEFE